MIISNQIAKNPRSILGMEKSIDFRPDNIFGEIDKLEFVIQNSGCLKVLI